MRRFLFLWALLVFVFVSAANAQAPSPQWWTAPLPQALPWLDRPVYAPPVRLPLPVLTLGFGAKVIAGTRRVVFDNSTLVLNFSDAASGNAYPRNTRFCEFDATAAYAGFGARYAYLVRQEDKFVVPGSVLSAALIIGGQKFGQDRTAGATAAASSESVSLYTQSDRHRFSLLVPISFDFFIRPALDVRLWSYRINAESTGGGSLQKTGSESWRQWGVGPGLYVEQPIGSWRFVADGAWYFQDRGYVFDVAVRYQPRFPLGAIPGFEVGYWVESTGIGPVRFIADGPYAALHLRF